MAIKLDMIQTVALAALLLFAGYGVRRRIGVIDRYNIPAPVVGGFLFALIALGLRMGNIAAFQFDTTLQVPLMIAFFTTIGLGANLALLKKGGPQVLIFWGLVSVFAVFQNALGLGIAKLLGVNPLLGLIAGSITMTGGHGTGAAFGKLIQDQYQFPGALVLAMGAATFGLVSGGIIGGPIATKLIQRNALRSAGGTTNPATLANARAAALDSEIDTEPKGEAPTAHLLLKTMAIILVTMAVGSMLSGYLARFMTLPAYIGAMIVAAFVCNAAQLTGTLKIEQRVVDDLGTIALSLFLTMALMSLDLTQLFALAVPMLVILVAQVACIGLFAYFVVFRVMGNDYDAAVMAGGHCGFGLGATPNAVANMESITERFGAAPRAFLVVPMVGAFFIDFTNALIITTYIDWVK